MDKAIPLSVPNLRGRELEYVTKAIETEWVSAGGSLVNEFEAVTARYLNVQKAVACQSGTSGLHLSLLLSGVRPGDEVIVPTLTFIAAVNPVRYLGAEPVFMDCDDTLNMDMGKLETFCKEECKLSAEGLINIKTHRRIKAVVIVHVFGNMADMERLMQIASEYGLTVVEDATEALGTCCTSGAFAGRFAGTIGDFGVYSFNGNKIITTGGGGMLVAGVDAMAEKARYLSNQAKDDPVYFKHDEVGYNYRMTSLQAALGIAQMENLEAFIATKIRNYNTYRNALNGVAGLKLLEFRANTRSNHWFYSLFIDREAYGLDRDQLLQVLSSLKIQTRPVWGLIHEQRPYLNNQAYDIQKALVYGKSVLNIPCSTNLCDEDIERIAAALKCHVVQELTGNNANG